MTHDAKPAPHILCVSWDGGLARTRELLLTEFGYKVTSALGPQESIQKCSTKADLIVLGHSVPRIEKQKVLAHFRQFSKAPALSLIAPGQVPLPEVEYAVEILDPGRLVSVIQEILPARRP